LAKAWDREERRGCGDGKLNNNISFYLSRCEKQNSVAFISYRGSDVRPNIWL